MELAERQEDMEPVLRLCFVRNSLALVGSHIDAIARTSISHIPIPAEADGPFHVTIATQDELSRWPKKFDEWLLQPGEDQDSIIDLGVSCQDGICFHMLFWRKGMEIRRMMDLPFKLLHLPLSEAADNHVSDGFKRSFEDLNVEDKFSNKFISRDQVSSIVHYCKFLVKTCSLTTATGKDIVSLLRQLLSNPRTRNGHVELLDLLAIVFGKTKDVDECLAACKKMMSRFPEDPRGYFRCAGCYSHIGRASARTECRSLAYCWKLAMILYGEAVKHALALDELQDLHGADKVVQQACQAILHCAEHTEFGCLMTCAEAETFPNEYLGLSVPWNPAVRNAVLQAFIARGEPRDSQLLGMESRERLCIYDQESTQFLKLPRFFRWITPFRVAAMSTPKNAEDVQLLARLGIGTVFTLTKEEELDSTWFTKSPSKSIKNIFVPVTNYRAPTTGQVDYFFSLVDHHFETNSAILVHCGGGKGRAGTFVASYLARYGFIGVPDEQPKYSATGVVQTLRHMRPGSIETDEQELFIAGFVKELWRRAQTGGKLLLIPEPELDNGENCLHVEGRFDPKSCKILVCCGIPGSGKSTVSTALARSGWTVASQDETGSRKACTAAVSSATRQKKSVIIDRCNPTISDRKEWIYLAMASPEEVACLFFDYDEVLCLQRAKLRLDHPTLTSDNKCSIAIRSMSKSLQRPSMKEGFGAIVTIKSIAAANKFIHYYCNSTESSDDTTAASSSSSSHRSNLESTRLSQFHKFPRTRHLFNFGSATRDDLIMTKAEAASFLSSSSPLENGEGEKMVVTFEEKVDGANLGLSIDPVTGQIRAQNRSHFVNSKSHAQYKKLDFWIETHREDLVGLLSPQHVQHKDDNVDQGPYILFGEWLQATHSIQYTKLSDYFLAFDLYDVGKDKFWSRDRFWKAMGSTSINVVPQILIQGDMTHEDVFKELMGKQSAFYDGRIEGVYVRRDRGPFLLDRSKVVRTDFISGNAHWSKQVGENIVRRF